MAKLGDALKQGLNPSESPAAGLPLEDADEIPPEQLDQMDLVLDEHDQLVENPDGSADIVRQDKKTGGTDFDANLAEHLEEEEMQTLASKLIKKIEHDKESRKKRDEQYEEGIRRTGLGQDAPGGASFQGASKVVHPLIAEACVDFAAATMKEIYPPDGPVRTKIEGKVTEQKIAIAKRQQRYLNWQLTEQMSEYVEELEQMLTQLPLGGSQYMKFWFDGRLKRLCSEFVPIDDIYLPYACSDFYTAQRVTHVQRLTDFVFEERCESGFYREIDTEEPGQAPETTKSETASAKVEGKDAQMDNVDGERIVYEVNTFCELSIDGEDEEHPYLISIDEHTGKVVAIYRNWDEEDKDGKRLDWLVEFGFIAWRGAYKIGLPHLIGGLSAAATGALRALLDSAHFNNLPGFLRLKGARLGGQTKEINPAQGVEIEASAAIDDIKKIVAPLPYNPPSPVLMELLGWLTDAGKGVVTTAEEKIKDATNEMPVGTALALIEQGAKVFSSIHARMHRSQRRAFKIMARLNKRHISIGEQMSALGEVLATRHDFGEALAVIPVSDPNIFSETQRYAQMQMVLQLAQGVDPKTGEPTATGKLHNLYEAIKRMYEIAKIPDFERFLPEPPKPQDLNAAAENAASMMNKPLMAFPEQDHYAHIETHMRFVTDPFLGGSGMAAQQTMPALMDHVKQHLAFLYATTVFDLVNNALGVDVGELIEQDKRVARDVDKIIAVASKRVHAELQHKLQPLGGTINQILSQIAQMQTPPPMDPSQAIIMAEKMKGENKLKELDKQHEHDKEIKGGDQQLKGQDLEIKSQAEQSNASLGEAELAAKREKDAKDAELKERELEIKAGAEDAKLQQADVHHQEGLQHEQQQSAQERQAQERSQQADQSFQSAQAQESQRHELGTKAMDHTHEAAMGAMGQGHEQNMQASDQAHQSSEGEADRDLAKRQQAAEFVAKDHELKQGAKQENASEQRQIEAQDKSQSREIKHKSSELKAKVGLEKDKMKHQERITDKTLKAKAQEAKNKPKPKGKK